MITTFDIIFSLFLLQNLIFINFEKSVCRQILFEPEVFRLSKLQMRPKPSEFFEYGYHNIFSAGRGGEYPASGFAYRNQIYSQISNAVLKNRIFPHAHNKF